MVGMGLLSGGDSVFSEQLFWVELQVRYVVPRTKLLHPTGGGWAGTTDISAKFTGRNRRYTGYGATTAEYGIPIPLTDYTYSSPYEMPYAAVAVASNTGIQGLPSRITCKLIAGQQQHCYTLNFRTTGGATEVRVRRNQRLGTMDLGGTIITSQWSNVRATNTAGGGFGRVSHYVLPMTLNMDSASRLDDAITIEMIYK